MSSFRLVVMFTCLIISPAITYAIEKHSSDEENILKHLLATHNKIANGLTSEPHISANAGGANSYAQDTMILLNKILRTIAEDQYGKGQKKFLQGDASSKTFNKIDQQPAETTVSTSVEGVSEKSVESEIPSEIKIKFPPRLKGQNAGGFPHNQRGSLSGFSRNRHYMTPLFMLQPSPSRNKLPETSEDEPRTLRKTLSQMTISPNSTETNMSKNAGDGGKSEREKQTRWFAVRRRLAKRLYGMKTFPLTSKLLPEHENDLHALVPAVN